MTDYDALLQVRREKYFYKALAFERFDRITEMEALLVEAAAWVPTHTTGGLDLHQRISAAVAPAPAPEAIDRGAAR